MCPGTSQLPEHIQRDPVGTRVGMCPVCKKLICIKDKSNKLFRHGKKK
jgi:hypothetical protein